MKNKASVASRIYMALVFVFLYAPIAVMMVFSFNSTTSTYQLEGFSTYWWKEMLLFLRFALLLQQVLSELWLP